MDVGAITSVSQALWEFAQQREQPESATPVEETEKPTDAAIAEAEGEKAQPENPAKSPAENELTPEEKRRVEELKKTDREVRAHEQAHKAAGGPYVISGPSYEYERGPDGRMYAIGGEVKLDVSEVPGDPEATIRKMKTIQRAALSVRDPSPADRRAASIAAQEESEARQELANEKGMKEQTKDGVFKSTVTVAEMYFGHWDAFPSSSMVDLTA